jgi:glycosyltransferase involved in cell wall biosynthesis
MNIAIDVSPIQSGHKARGIGMYTKMLVDALQLYGKNLSYQIIRYGQDIPSSADIVHYPYFDPFLPTLPFVKTKPTIVTVHDLIPIVFPDKFPKGIRGIFIWQKQKASLKGSRLIITDSQNSKNDIQRIIGFNKDNISVVPLAPSSIFQPVKEKSVLSWVRKKYQLPKDYFLYVGDVNWNKNVSGLLKAFAIMVHSKPSVHVSLVLVGLAFLNNDIKEMVEINRLIEALNIRTSVIRTGFVPESDLVSIYNLAMCLVQPSWYEGFGFPILEAMASGCPVITSNASSLAEIAGPAKCIEPNDVDGIAIQMHMMYRISREDRLKLIRKGITWASKFTWEKVARETIQAYERVFV